MQIIDTHTHIDDEKYNIDISEVIKRAKDENKFIINIGCDLESSIASIELAKKYSDFIWASVGYHPHNAKDYDEAKLNKLLDKNSDKIVAIGEIGLDYHYGSDTKNIQKEVFRKQLRLAKKRNLPVVIHNRDANEDSLEIVKSENITNGVFHFFSGDINMALELLHIGFYLSFGGVVTFKNSDRLELIKKIPLNKILLETDCPYVTPHPFRGKRNEPAYIKYVAETIADALLMPVDKLINIANENAEKLFKIKF